METGVVAERLTVSERIKSELLTAAGRAVQVLPFAGMAIGLASAGLVMLSADLPKITTDFIMSPPTIQALQDTVMWAHDHLPAINVATAAVCGINIAASNLFPRRETNLGQNIYNVGINLATTALNAVVFLKQVLN